MLYGVRPFGEGKSQENVWSEGLVFNSAGVEFPSTSNAPKVSDEAKDLIRACLTKDQRHRYVCIFNVSFSLPLSLSTACCCV
jgi:tousled-like kinase